MKSITIKPLTSGLNGDYLDFFDNRAFTDDNPNGHIGFVEVARENGQVVMRKVL